jgi:hypothetical protein
VTHNFEPSEGARINCILVKRINCILVKMIIASAQGVGKFEVGDSGVKIYGGE